MWNPVIKIIRREIRDILKIIINDYLEIPIYVCILFLFCINYFSYFSILTTK